MKFKTKGPSMIYLSRVGARIRFDKNGEFSTSDPKVIAVLQNHRSVLVQSKDEPRAETVAAQVHLDEQTKDAPDQQDTDREPVVESAHTRDELDRMAKEAGLDPEDYSTKAEVAEAINKV